MIPVIHEHVRISAIAFRNAVCKWALFLWDELQIFAFGELDSSCESGRARLNSLTSCSRRLLKTVIYLSHLSTGQFGISIAYCIQKFRSIVMTSVELRGSSHGHIHVWRLSCWVVSSRKILSHITNTSLNLVFADFLKHGMPILSHLGLILFSTLDGVVSNHDASFLALVLYLFRWFVNGSFIFFLHTFLRFVSKLLATLLDDIQFVLHHSFIEFHLHG